MPKAPDKTAPSLARRTPLLEWAAAGVGLALTGLVVGHALWEGSTRRDEPPALQVRAGPPTATPGGWRVEVKVSNASRQTASSVQVTGRATRPGGEAEEASVVFDYLPAQGEKTGGLMFRDDPRAGALEVGVTGYVEP